MSLQTIPLEIDGAAIELQPRFGDPDGAVLHMLPGGTANPEGFAHGGIRDVYAFTCKGKGTFRGGHYHLANDELFFTVCGTALWVLSDFRETSPTFGKTVGVIVGEETPAETCGHPCHVIADGSLARVRVPAGVYHALFPLTDVRVTTTALGSAPFDKNDYRYPAPHEVPGMAELISKFGILMPERAGA